MNGEVDELIPIEANLKTPDFFQISGVKRSEKGNQIIVCG